MDRTIASTRTNSTSGQAQRAKYGTVWGTRTAVLPLLGAFASMDLLSLFGFFLQKTNWCLVFFSRMIGIKDTEKIICVVHWDQKKKFMLIIIHTSYGRGFISRWGVFFAADS